MKKHQVDVLLLGLVEILVNVGKGTFVSEFRGKDLRREEYLPSRNAAPHGFVDRSPDRTVIEIQVRAVHVPPPQQKVPEDGAIREHVVVGHRPTAHPDAVGGERVPAGQREERLPRGPRPRRHVVRHRGGPRHPSVAEEGGREAAAHGRDDRREQPPQRQVAVAQPPEEDGQGQRHGGKESAKEYSFASSPIHCPVLTVLYCTCPEMIIF